MAEVFKIQKREWVLVLLITLGILSFTSIPYIYGYISAPDEKVFMGFTYNVDDHTQYYSWYTAFQSEFLISNHQTSEANPEIFFNLLWWVLAQFGKITGLSFAAVYQIFRWFSGTIFLFMAYIFISMVFTQVQKRRLAFLITAFGSGFGWVLVLIKYLFRLPDTPFPLDIFVSEGNSFFCIMSFPHFMQATAFILGVFVLLLVGEKQNQLRFSIYAGISALILGFTHAYDLFIVWSIPLVYAGILFIRQRKFPSYWFKAMLITGLLSWPPALYSFLLTRLNPIWKDVLAQFDNAGVFTPSPLHMFILMGLPLVLALVTFILLILKRDSEFFQTQTGLFVAGWFIAGWLLTYLPTDFQIHMINSWQIPIILLATLFLSEQVFPLLNKIKPGVFSFGLFSVLVIGLVFLTNLYLFSWRILDLGRHTYPYYLGSAEVEMLELLEEKTSENSVVLSSYNTGMYIPGLSGRTAFFSHWAQTVNYFEKRDFVNSFYSDELTHIQSQKYLLEYGIGYVLFGPAERELGALEPGILDFLELVEKNSQVELYKVITDE